MFFFIDLVNVACYFYPKARQKDLTPYGRVYENFINSSFSAFDTTKVMLFIYFLQECIATTKDWRKCQTEVNDFRSCITKHKQQEMRIIKS